MIDLRSAAATARGVVLATRPRGRRARHERRRGRRRCGRRGPADVHDYMGQPDAQRRIHRKGEHPLQHHDGTGGHLAPVSENVELVSELELTTELGRVSDVSSLGDHAYLGAYAEPVCSTGGIWVVDISDPENPRKVGRSATSARRST